MTSVDGITAIFDEALPGTSQVEDAVADALVAGNYKIYRAMAYDARGCSYKDYVDAVTKQSSSDAALKAEGDAQLVAVLAARLKIKTDYPYIS